MSWLARRELNPYLTDRGQTECGGELRCPSGPAMKEYRLTIDGGRE